MLEVSLFLIFLAFFLLIMGFNPIDTRPTLKLEKDNSGAILQEKKKAEKRTLLSMALTPIRKLALFNKPLTLMPVGQRVARDIYLSQTNLTVEEFFLIKEILIFILPSLAIKFFVGTDLFIFIILFSFTVAYVGPDFWLRSKVKRIKDILVKELPDVVDLIGLCVNAGLDFMMAIKYIVEKSTPTVTIKELQNMLQEISVGKSRREALRDMAKKYELTDLYTFTRTLVQADRMGTSVAEALNILSEDMREARFRRGETVALKAPLKMLVPLLFCIFPVVAILVAGPIFLDFFHNNPLQKLAA